MSVNFDAKLTLDISMFMRNIKTAENAFDNLARKIQTSRINIPSPQLTQMDSLFAGPSMANAAAEKQASDSKVRNLARERYALYDVAAAYQQMSDVAVGALTAVIGTSIDYERAFANVVRTTDFVSARTGEAARVMRFELMQLAAEIPVAFGQITEIATIGNQLGIAQKDLVNFTETVGKFAATTDVTVNNAALSFGRIGELLEVSDFNALGSAIAFAGVNAVATETQILAVTKEISTTAKQAKFAAPDVIGLATALSSLGIAPEAARGSIIRSFAAINAAITKGGADLQAYASIAGMSSQQFASTWQESGSTAFDALLRGLQAASDQGNNLDSVLRGLGIRNVRDIQTLQKLGDNYDVYAQSIRDANDAYAEGTFLSESYGVIQETVAAKLQVIQNQIANLFATLGESTSGPLKTLLDVISFLIEELTRLARNPAFQAIGVFAVAVTALVAGVAALNAIVNLTKASMLAFNVAMNGGAAASTAAAGGVTTFRIALLQALGVVRKFVVAAAAAFGAVQVISTVGDAIQRLVAPMDYARRKAEELIGGFNGLQDALTADYASALKTFGDDVAIGAAIASGELEGLSAEAINTNDNFSDLRATQDGYAVLVGNDVAPAIKKATDELVSQNVVLGDNFKAWAANALQQDGAFDALAKNKDLVNLLDKIGFSLEGAITAASNGQSVLDYIRGLGNEAQNLSLAEQALLAFNFAMDNVQTFGGSDLGRFATAIDGIVAESALLAPLLGKAATELNNGAEGAGELEEGLTGAVDALRTVVDYANDLSGILNRVVDLEFGKILGRDEISNAFARIAETAADAAEEIRKANLEISDLRADRGTLEYQLSVAERYGDEVRAAKLRAEIAKINENIAKQEAKIAESTNKASRDLTGNTEAARRNRSELIGVVETYQSYIATLARLGRKPTQLAGDIDNLRKEFRKQALDLGYSESELSDYLALFDNFGEVAEDAPRDVDIEVNLGLTAAQQAIDEFVAKNKEMGVTAKVTTDPKTITPKVATPDTNAADNYLTAWSSKGWTIKPPIVDNITADAADRKLTDWSNKMRYFRPIIADRVDTAQANARINAWLAETRKISAELQIRVDKALVKRQADTFLELARANSTNKTAYDTYTDLYRIMNRLQLSMATGGYVRGPGTGTSDSIPARLSNGEFVMRASSVKAYGVDFMNAINQQKLGGVMPASVSTTAGSGTTIAYLSPEDRALLRAAVERPVELYADSRKIAETANEGNKLIARRGVR